MTLALQVVIPVVIIILLTAAVGYAIDRDAARHEREGDD